MRAIIFSRYRETGTGYYAHYLAELLHLPIIYCDSHKPPALQLNESFLVLSKPPDVDPSEEWRFFLSERAGHYIYLEWDMHSLRMLPFNEVLSKYARLVLSTSLEQSQETSAKYLQLWCCNYWKVKNAFPEGKQNINIGLDYLSFDGNAKKIVEVCSRAGYKVIPFNKDGYSPIYPNKALDAPWSVWFKKMMNIHIMIDQPKEYPRYKPNLKMVTSMSFGQIPVFPVSVQANRLFNLDTLYSHIDEIPTIINNLLSDLHKTRELRSECISAAENIKQEDTLNFIKEEMSALM